MSISGLNSLRNFLNADLVPVYGRGMRRVKIGSKFRNVSRRGKATASRPSAVARVAARSFSRR